MRSSHLDKRIVGFQQMLSYGIVRSGLLINSSKWMLSLSTKYSRDMRSDRANNDMYSENGIIADSFYIKKMKIDQTDDWNEKLTSSRWVKSTSSVSLLQITETALRIKTGTSRVTTHSYKTLCVCLISSGGARPSSSCKLCNYELWQLLAVSNWFCSETKIDVPLQTALQPYSM